MTNLQLYGSLPVTTKIQQRRMRIAGHCARHKKEVASKLALWQPVDGKAKRGRKNMSYIDNLLEDCGVEQTGEIRSCMLDRDIWRDRVSSLCRPGGRPK